MLINSMVGILSNISDRHTVHFNNKAETKSEKQLKQCQRALYTARMSTVLWNICFKYIYVYVWVF